jgi:hypothetical protein
MLTNDTRVHLRSKEGPGYVCKEFVADPMKLEFTFLDSTFTQFYALFYRF